MENIIYDPVPHTYTVNGILLPSVTTITRYLSVDIAENANPFMRDVAANRGSRVHEYCVDLDYTQGEETDVDYDCRGYVQAYANFLRDYDYPDWSMIERQIASPSLGIAGTVDRVGILSRRPAIVDIKTSASLNHESGAAQLDGYDAILSSPDCIPAQAYQGGYDHYLLHLRKDGTYYLVQEKRRSLWLKCYELEMERKRWKNKKD